MASRFQDARLLVRQSLAILKQDRELVWFPIISGALTFLVMLSFAYPIWQNVQSEESQSVMYYAWLFVFYLISYFIISFFNAGLVTCVALRFQGQNPTFRDGWNNALKHIGPLFLWALLSSTVGILLRYLENKSGLFGRIVTGLVGMAWSLVTYFVIPLIVLENFAVPRSIRRSGELFKKTWGENLIGNISMSLVFFAFGLGGLVVGGLMMWAAFAVATGDDVFIIVFGIGLLILAFFTVLSIVQTTLQGIFNTALYIFSQTGKVLPGLSPELVQGAFRSKTKKI